MSTAVFDGSGLGGIVAADDDENDNDNVRTRRAAETMSVEPTVDPKKDASTNLFWRPSLPPLFNASLALSSSPLSMSSNEEERPCRCFTTWHTEEPLGSTIGVEQNPRILSSHQQGVHLAVQL